MYVLVFVTFMPSCQYTLQICLWERDGWRSRMPSKPMRFFAWSNQERGHAQMPITCAMHCHEKGNIHHSGIQAQECTFRNSGILYGAPAAAIGSQCIMQRNQFLRVNLKIRFLHIIAASYRKTFTIYSLPSFSIISLKCHS